MRGDFRNRRAVRHLRRRNDRQRERIAIQFAVVHVGHHADHMPRILRELRAHSFANQDLGSFSDMDPSTASSYLSMLKVHIRPRWGDTSLSKVRPGLVQEWLRGLDVAPKTKGHIKALMHRLFEKAMLWELFPFGRNPMELVHVKGISKRTKVPTILEEKQCYDLISSVPEPYRTMVVVAICTGLRVSEILALRWSRIDFARQKCWSR